MFELTSDAIERLPEDQKKVFIDVADAIENGTKDLLEAKLAKLGLDTSAVEGSDPEFLKFRRQVDRVKQIWRNGGRIPGSLKRMDYTDLVEWDEKLTKDWSKSKLFADTQFSSDQPLLIKTAIAEQVMEAIEPRQVIAPLFNKIYYDRSPHITFPSTGGFHAADVGEGEEYPERRLDFAGKTVCEVGKSGVKVKMTDEMVKYSQWDVMAMHLRHAGRALARWKETKAIDLITDDGSVIIDNSSSTTRSSSGRKADGTENGTLTLNDLFHVYTTMLNRGFTPDTLIMNPFAWVIFADEAISRVFNFDHGRSLWQAPGGSAGKAEEFGAGHPLGRLVKPTNPENLATTYTNVPSMFPTNFNIVVSPYMPVDTTNNLTHIAMVDSSELGVHLISEEVTTEDWRDPARDIQMVKMREQYGFALMNEGYGVGLMKYISLDRGYDFHERLQATYSIPGWSSGDSFTGDYSGDTVGNTEI